MEREQIIKALECCYTNNLSCSDCPFQETDKYFECSGLTINALALIRELTEENTRLQTDYNDLYESTTEEIKRLKAELDKRPPRLIITKKSG